MLKKYIYLLLILPLAACIDPYVVNVESGEQLLTVEGTITTTPGVQSIRLTRSDTYGSIFEGLIRPVSNATVVIRDDQGKVIFLTEDTEDRGVYYTPENFAAVVGRSYTLQIQLVDGKVYTSLPELVNSVPEIKNIDVKVVKIAVEGEVLERSGVQLIAEIEDPSDQNNFYYWRTDQSTYILKTRPDLYTPNPNLRNPPSREPEPKDCCIVCFKTELLGSQGIYLEKDDIFNGLNTKVAAGFIEDDGKRFVETLRTDLRQMSISQEAYRFLRLVKQQTEVSGSVFDPPPANIRGNMISLDDPEEVVLGYFMAAGETVKRIYIQAEDLDFTQPAVIIPDDCREIEGAQLNPPVDWNP
ncbi:DUF4249 domain-containing protein [Algoriphagus halophilus]|uniref:DUF4249 domain-containing protein n=1 Tax=Algoriphagus halophilus TaxID=226505 RepID=A0A1N6HSZ5_9BACT|nr:DUF4249 domain-containing protein [Algoriphagus halophilus]SIO22944.1 protein of unknown function [Algoriphagus halophilus]